MKKLFVFVLCMTALTACNQKGQQSSKGQRNQRHDGNPE